MSNGVIAGYPMTSIHCILTGGKFHEVDSSEMDFRVAAGMAFSDGARKAKSLLLEPMMNVEVVIPEAYMGAVVGDLNSRRGKINGMVPRDKMTVVAVSVPLAEMFGYASALRNVSQGRAAFTMEFASYQPVPAAIAKKMLEKTKV